MKFLFTSTSPSQKILVVQTCNPDLYMHVLKKTREVHEKAEITALLQKHMRNYLPDHLPVDHIIQNQLGKKKSLVQRLRKEKYDTIVIIESGEVGYWKLKLLVVMLAPRNVLLSNRIGEIEYVSLYKMILRMIKRRPQLVRVNYLRAPIIAWNTYWYYRNRTSKIMTNGNGQDHPLE